MDLNIDKEDQKILISLPNILLSKVNTNERRLWKNKENIRENTTDPIYLVVLHFNFTKKVGRKKSRKRFGSRKISWKYNGFYPSSWITL